jgi:hypothetical protein
MAGSKPVGRAVIQIWRAQCDLITRSQALDGGMTEAGLRSRLRPGGTWRIVLPGVYLVHNGGLTLGQREAAAVLYAGKPSVITGNSALARLGIRVPTPEIIDVLVPHEQRRQSADFVRIHRTIRMPEQPWRLNGLQWAPPARAVADAVRGFTDMDSVRALVAGAVQQRKCTVLQLAAELRAGPNRGSGALRAALEEVADGIGSVAEGDLRKLIRKGRLPEPMYNPSLFVGAEFLASPDAWWPDAGVAGEVDSREWHLSPADWQRTQARHARMSAHGILVLHYAPSRIRSDPAGVVAEISKALEAGRRRGPLAIRTVPAR